MIKNIGQFCLMCIRKILPYLSFIVIISGVMVFLMWGVYTIPVEKIRPNAVKSAEIINGMPEHVPFKIKVPGLFFDTWTDPRMLNMASFLGSGNALKDSLLNPRVYYGVFIPYPKAQYNIFLPYINLNIAVKKYDLEGAKIEEYSRLWQGWMIFLKPLLMFFDLAKIRIINLFLQLVLLIMIIRLIFQKLGFTHCMAFVTAMLFLNPILSWQCLEFATDVNIMLLATLWVLLNKNPDDKYMFFVIGAVTIAFDWLTYPLITLGIPLIVYVLLYQRSFKENIFCVLKNSLLWISGYALMMFSKWLVATLLTDENVFQNAFASVQERSNGMMLFAEMKKAVKANFLEFYNEGTLLYFFFFTLGLTSYVFIKPCQFKKNVNAIILLGIGFMPFVWYSVLVDHSNVHPWMTYKILIITIYAVLSAFVGCLKPIKRGK